MNYIIDVVNEEGMSKKDLFMYRCLPGYISQKFVNNILYVCVL